MLHLQDIAISWCFSVKIQHSSLIKCIADNDKRNINEQIMSRVMDMIHALIICNVLCTVLWPPCYKKNLPRIKRTR